MSSIGCEDIAKRHMGVQANGPRPVRTASYFLGPMAARNSSTACQFSDSLARYLVTSLGAQHWPARKLYEQLYCARGEMENHIKEQLRLFADRLNTETLRANQLRRYFSSRAYVLLEALRRLGRAGTEWAEARVATIRLRLLKIAAQVRVTARRIWMRYSRAYPWQNVFAAAYTALRR